MLAGSGLIALGYLYNRFDQLYESQRSTTARLKLLTAQLQKLQEAAVLDSDRPCRSWSITSSARRDSF